MARPKKSTEQECLKSPASGMLDVLTQPALGRLLSPRRSERDLDGAEGMLERIAYGSKRQLVLPRDFLGAIFGLAKFIEGLCPVFLRDKRLEKMEGKSLAQWACPDRKGISKRILWTSGCKIAGT